jgi:hypothetical protein
MIASNLVVAHSSEQNMPRGASKYSTQCGYI